MSAFAEQKLRECRRIVRQAEKYAKQQVMPESNICMAALKDLRRVLFAKQLKKNHEHNTSISKLPAMRQGTDIPRG